MQPYPLLMQEKPDVNLLAMSIPGKRLRNHVQCSSGGLQGTAATACAGVYGALAVQGKPSPSIADQRFVVVGAGSAGMGVTTMLSLCLIKHVSLLLACCLGNTVTNSGLLRLVKL